MARDSEEVTVHPRDKIEEWLLDYTYACALEEFGETGTVDNAFNRDIIQGLVNVVIQRENASAKSQQQVKNLLVMCCLADGSDATLSESEDGVHRTRLEDVIHLIPELSTIFKDKTVFESWVCDLKRQAVYVCCRTGNFGLAANIFKRIWTGKEVAPTSTSKVVKVEVKGVLHSEDPDHPTLEAHPYQKLLQQTYKMLQVLETDPEHIPHLHLMALQAEQGQVDPVGKSFSSVACQTDEAPLPKICNQRLIKEFKHFAAKSKLPHLEGKPYRLPAKLQRNFSRVLKDISQNRELYSQKMPSFDTSDGDASTTSDDERLYESPSEPKPRSTKKSSPIESPRIKSIRSPVHARNRSSSHSTKYNSPRAKLKRKNDDVTDDTSSSPVETNKKSRRTSHSRRLDYDEEVGSNDDSKGDIYDLYDSEEDIFRPLTLPPKLRLRKSLAPAEPTRNGKKTFSRTAQRIPWSEREEEELYKSVMKYGLGKWSSVISSRGAKAFPDRTNVHLKDKWRTMLNNGRLEELEMKFGPI